MVRLFGHVTDSNTSQAISWATVQVFDVNGAFHSAAYTDSTGRYETEEIPWPSGTLKCHKSGYRDDQQDFFVGGSGGTSYDFTLEPE